MRSFITAYLLSSYFTLSVGRDCKEGDAICTAVVSQSSWCKVESNTCHGNPAVICHCEERAISPPSPVLGHNCTGALCLFGMAGRPAESVSLPVRTPPADLVGDKLCISRVGPSSWCRDEDGTCQGNPAIVCDARIVRRTGEAVSPAASSAAVPDSPRNDIFLWLEWPTLEPDQWPLFYDKVIDFISSNCANYRVTRVIARVLTPLFHQQYGKLWQVGTDSVFYTNFLSRVPVGVDVQIYPHLVGDDSVEEWISSMKVDTPLEGAYKYVSQWNQLLIRSRSRVVISGIVTDKEESRHFLNDLRRIPAFKEAYSNRGQPSLRFGIAMGYTQPDGAPSISPHIDDVYLEMYDFYVDRVYPPALVDAGTMVNNPHRFLAELDANVWGRYLPFYARERNLHFMWSSQHRGPGCLFPNDSNQCGSKDDFGNWDVTKVNEFFALLESRYPSFRSSPKGFFQFSFIPKSWAQSCPRDRP